MKLVVKSGIEAYSMDRCPAESDIRCPDVPDIYPGLRVLRSLDLGS